MSNFYILKLENKPYIVPKIIVTQNRIILRKLGPKKLYSSATKIKLLFKVGNKRVPRCTGPCLIYCANQWGTRNYWPNECIGNEYCTCTKDGAVCK